MGWGKEERGRRKREGTIRDHTKYYNAVMEGERERPSHCSLSSSLFIKFKSAALSSDSTLLKVQNQNQRAGPETTESTTQEGL